MKVENGWRMVKNLADPRKVTLQKKEKLSLKQKMRHPGLFSCSNTEIHSHFCSLAGNKEYVFLAGGEGRWAWAGGGGMNMLEKRATDTDT